MKLIRVLTATLFLGALPVLANTVQYDFDDGTMQGWVNKSISTKLGGYYDLQFAPVTKEQKWDTTTNNPGLGAYFLGEQPSTNDSRTMTWASWPAPASSVHLTLWVQSPAFVLDGSGDLTFFGSGSDGPTNRATGKRNMSLTNTPIPALAGTWGPEGGNLAGTEGLCAVGLRRDDGTFVLSANFADFGNSWSTNKFTAAQLLPYVNDGHTYTLNMVDALAGTAAWCAIDKVRIPGVAGTLLPPPALRICIQNATLLITWKPTVAGYTQTLVSSEDLARPVANWDVVRTVQTQNGATSVEIPLPTRTTFFRVRSMPIYVDCSLPSGGLANQACCSGDNATFSISGGGVALTYQWYKGATLLPGQSGSSLTITNVSTSDLGAYSVVVTSILGNSITNTATLSVSQSVSVLSSPTNVTASIGGSATFRVSASGAGLTYKWYKDDALLSGQTSSTLTVANISAANLGIYTVVINGSCGSASCSATLYTALPTADYLGNKFVTNAAPVLTFQRKLSPTLTGIDYDFPEQTAHGVALLSRFPPFTNSASRIHVDGPWYNDPSANLHFSRGITTVGAVPNYRKTTTAPTTLLKVGPEHKWHLIGDPTLWTMAVNFANQLEQQNPSDPRISPLRTLGTNHVFVNDESSFKSLGYYIYQQQAWATDIEGRYVHYPCLDIESTGNWQYQRNCFGWLYQGMAQYANEHDLTFVPMLYGQYQYSVSAFYNSTRQGGANGTGDPEYLNPTKDFLSVADPTMVACQQNNGILSMDGYMQAIWGKEPFYKRNGDNSLQLVNGLPVFNDITNSSAYGCSLYMEPASTDKYGNPVATESKHCLDNLYRQAVRMYLQHHWRAGQYPANSSIKKSFLTNAKIGAWQRYTNEGMDNVDQNDRPLPPWLLDLCTAMFLFTGDDITIWSSDMNFVPGALGANYTSNWRFNAHGVLEDVVRGAHRYSALDPLHASTNTYQWCWFNLPLINQNTTAGDRYFEKPIAFGKLRPFEGHTYLELFIAWPVLDNTAKDFKVWIDKNGTQSKAYTVRVKNGRTYFYDAWQLPDSFTGLQGKDIWLRTTDLLNVQRTWRGDYRVTATNTVPTPADY